MQFFGLCNNIKCKKLHGRVCKRYEKTKVSGANSMDGDRCVCGCTKGMHLTTVVDLQDSEEEEEEGKKSVHKDQSVAHQKEKPLAGAALAKKMSEASTTAQGSSNSNATHSGRMTSVTAGGATADFLFKTDPTKVDGSRKKRKVDAMFGYDLTKEAEETVGPASSGGSNDGSDSESGSSDASSACKRRRKTQKAKRQKKKNHDEKATKEKKRKVSKDETKEVNTSASKVTTNSKKKVSFASLLSTAVPSAHPSANASLNASPDDNTNVRPTSQVSPPAGTGSASSNNNSSNRSAVSSLQPGWFDSLAQQSMNHFPDSPTSHTARHTNLAHNNVAAPSAEDMMHAPAYLRTNRVWINLPEPHIRRSFWAHPRSAADQEMAAHLEGAPDGVIGTDADNPRKYGSYNKNVFDFYKLEPQLLHQSSCNNMYRYCMTCHSNLMDGSKMECENCNRWVFRGCAREPEPPEENEENGCSEFYIGNRVVCCYCYVFDRFMHGYYNNNM